jgi:hypothetical protein
MTQLSDRIGIEVNPGLIASQCLSAALIAKAAMTARTTAIKNSSAILSLASISAQQLVHTHRCE